MRRRLIPVVLAAVSALLLSACSTTANSHVVTAEFEDVFDLVYQGGVRHNNVTVGEVIEIEYNPERDVAVVTMTIDRRMAVPADVEPWISRTSVLGERYVDLVAAEGARCDLDTGAGCITSTDLGEGQMRSDLEELVAAGSELLSVVTAETVGRAIRAGEEILVGREELIGDFITDVRTLANTWTERGDELTEFIDALDGVTSAYAPNAAANAAVLADLNLALAALDELDDDLLDTLDDMVDLSDVATQFFERNNEAINDGLRRLRLVLQAVARADGDLEYLLSIAPRYLSTINRGWSPVDGANRGETNVWGDIIICGLTDDPNDPSRSCEPLPGTEPGFHPLPEECWDPDLAPDHCFEGN